jgi:hypothetical protein
MQATVSKLEAYVAPLSGYATQAMVGSKSNRIEDVRTIESLLVGAEFFLINQRECLVVRVRD